MVVRWRPLCHAEPIRCSAEPARRVDISYAAVSGTLAEYPNRKRRAIAGTHFPCNCLRVRMVDQM